MPGGWESRMIPHFPMKVIRRAMVLLIDEEVRRGSGMNKKMNVTLVVKDLMNSFFLSVWLR